MTLFAAFADVLLYAAFAYLTGFIVLQFVPDDRKPQVTASKTVLFMCIAGIALLSAAPVIELTAVLENGQGWIEPFLTVLMDYRIGQGLLIAVLLSIIFSFTVYFKASKYVQAYFLVLLILVVGFFSHVSTLSLWPGFLSHSLHFLAMSMWAGVLLHIAWFSKTGDNWFRFLKWFTPFATICMALLIFSGIVLMLFFVEPADYATSWVLPYGQLLLLKHLSIIPLLLAALINGFLSKQRGFNPLWLKVESVLLLIVFLFTAFMSKQAPPHTINNTFRSEGMAPFVEMLKGEQYIPLTASFAMSVNGVLLLLLSLLFLGMMLLGFYRRATPWLGLLFGTVFIVMSYAGLMLSVSF